MEQIRDGWQRDVPAADMIRIFSDLAAAKQGPSQTKGLESCGWASYAITGLCGAGKPDSFTIVGGQGTPPEGPARQSSGGQSHNTPPTGAK
jgi:hypothetical protein